MKKMIQELYGKRFADQFKDPQEVEVAVKAVQEVLTAAYKNGNLNHSELLFGVVATCWLQETLS